MSEKKIQAARANGALSKGPVTPEGKARSAMNALKHGLRCRRVRLSNESEAVFQSLLDEYSAALQPVGPVERDLVREIAVTRWRLMRTWDIEAAMIDDEMDRQAAQIAKQYKAIDEPTRVARAIRSLAAGWPYALVGRTEARLRRTLSRACAELDRLQFARKKVTNEPTAVVENPPEELVGQALPPARK